MGKKAFLLALARGARGKDAAKALILPDYYIDGSAGAEGVPQTVSGDAPLHFEDALRTPMEHLITNIKPVQDLHGYDSPWPAGGGVNILPYPFRETTKTVNGITFTDNGDGSITINGTATSTAPFVLWRNADFPAGQTIAAASFRTGSKSGIVGIYDRVSKLADNGSGSFATYPDGYTQDIRIDVNTGATCTNYTIWPMLVIGSTIPTAYAPYSNVCPISGWQTITAWDDAKYGGNIEWNQQANPQRWGSQTINGVTFTKNNDGSLVANGTASAETWCGLYPTFGESTSTGIRGHKYLFKGCPANGSTDTYYMQVRYIGGNAKDVGDGSIWLYDTNYSGSYSIFIANGYTCNNITFYPQCYDLTAMFGAGNEPSTVEEFRALFPKPYYPYNAGTHTSVGEVNGSGYWKVPVTFGALGKNLYNMALQRTAASNSYYGFAPTNNSDYTFTVGIASSGIYVEYSDEETMPDSKSGNWSSLALKYNNATISFNSGTHKWIRIMVYMGGGLVETTYQLEYGSTSTSYEPYTDTIYGGTLDLATGDGTIDKACVDLGDLAWEYTGSSNKYFQTKSIMNIVKAPVTGSTVADAMCEAYKMVSWNATTYATGLMAIAGANNPDPGRLSCINTNYTDTTLFAAAMSGIKLCFEIATPIPFHIDGLSIKPLKGDNNVWTDCGDTLSATYTVNAPVKTLEVTGEPPLSLPYSVGKPLKAWSVDVLPKQDLHGYDNPWPAGGGKNLFNWDRVVGTPNPSSEDASTSPRVMDTEHYYVGLTRNNYYRPASVPQYSVSNGIVSLTMTAGGFGIGFPVKVDPSTIYTVSYANATNAKISEGFYDADWNFLSHVDGGVTFTTPANAAYVTLIVTPINIGECSLSNIQLELGSTATSYAPYSNICPIHGTDKLTITTAGKNLFSIADVDYTVDGVRFVSENNVITVTGTAESGRYPNKRWNFPIQLPAGQYTLSASETNRGDRLIRIWLSNNTFVAINGALPYTFIAPADVVAFQYACNGGSTYDDVLSNIQLEFATATPYTPYLAQSQIVIDVPAEAGTVYGGSLTIAEDGSGVLTVDRVIMDMGIMEWDYNTTYAFFTSNSISTRKIGVLNVWSDLFKTMAGSWSGTPVQNALWGNGLNTTLYVQTPPLDNVNDFMALVDGHQLMYELATPITYTLTAPTIPTPTGTATTWATAEDGTVDDMTVKYKGHVMPGGES